jgi:hypothetical protein
VFGLAQEIGCTKLAVNGFIRNNQGLRGTSDQIDTDAAKKLSFGFGHEGVARSNDHRYGSDASGAERHGGNRLHPAHAVDLVCPAKVHGSNHRRAGLAMIRRRGGDDPGYARDFRSHHAHVGGSHQRIFAAWNVATHRVNRHVLVPENDSRKRLDFDIAQGRTLRSGE